MWSASILIDIIVHLLKIHYTHDQRYEWNFVNFYFELSLLTFIYFAINLISVNSFFVYFPLSADTCFCKYINLVIDS